MESAGGVHLTNTGNMKQEEERSSVTASFEKIKSKANAIPRTQPDCCQWQTCVAAFSIVIYKAACKSAFTVLIFADTCVRIHGNLRIPQIRRTALTGVVSNLACVIREKNEAEVLKTEKKTS